MKIALSLFVVIASICVVRCELDTEWQNYKVQFNKNYDSKDDSFRKEIFRLTKQVVDEHNKLYEAGKTTFKMGLNHLSDWTIEEISKIMGGHENEEISSQWEDYKLSYNKHYDAQEDIFRKTIFSKNLGIINEHNKKFVSGESSYEMGINKFTDMTFEEFKKYL